MALGGGTFVTQNKELPGAYINFVSAASADAALSGRGIATMPLELDWGVTGKVFEVTNADFQKNSMEIFGYAYTDEKLKGLRDLFLNTRTLYAYRLNGGEKAGNDYAEAFYPGIRGNELKIVICRNADDMDLFDVKTVLGSAVVDEQTVKQTQDLQANQYVRWKPDAALEATAGMPLAGGTNGTVDGASYQAYLDQIESYTYNVMGAVVTDDTTKALLASFTKRLRDEMGIKFQLVLHDYAKADYYGVISVKNKITDPGWSEAGLVYWVTGASAGCEVNKSNQNKKYDGSFTVDTAYTQNQLKAAVKSGEFTLHKAGADVRVLEDINTKVTVSDTEGAIFQDNQTVRVVDQIGNDIAVLFCGKYLGVVPNDNAGRISLWSDIVKHHEQLREIRAIEDFSDSDIAVEPGETKRSVTVRDAVTVVNAMSRLYMVCTIG